jgi:hypothetical protein
VNSVFEDALFRRASILCGIDSCCACATVNVAAEMTVETTTIMRDNLILIKSASIFGSNG